MTVPKLPPDLSVRTPGSLVDLAFALREQRKLIEARAELIKADEQKIIDHLIERCTKTELTKLAGKIAQASLVKTDMPHVTDWDLLNAWMVKNDAWDVRNRAANAAAFRARWEAGEQIPGVEKFTQVKLNIRKL